MPLRAADLLTLYRLALEQDPALAAARASLAASRERLVQARAAEGFTATVTAGASINYADTHLRGLPSALGGQFDRGFLSGSVTAQLTKPLVRTALRVNIEQAEASVRLGELSVAAAEQEVALRTAQAYFDVLLAEDNLRLVRAQKAAVSEQLAFAKRNFEVGTATIVDTNEAQARFDQVQAQEIAASNELERARWALRNVVGRYETSLRPLRDDISLARPSPDNMEPWVTRAERDAYPVRLAQQALAVTEYEVRRAQAGKDWTLDAVASATHYQNTGSATSSRGSWGTSGQIGVQFSLPLDLSGAVESRIREALANVERARNDLESARRTAALAARQAYLGVVNGIASVAAQQQALKSAETLLASTKLGLEVGVRTNLDVLNAQQQLTAVQRDLAAARYNAILAELRLRAAVGALGEADIRGANSLLAR
ncbi:MAG: TolC family outer membrane protein [Casimicrobiaceae bacterium]|nr:TolC family outer membrane protein [Casimicrobiaceae bacterium]MCX8098745.1 TolC family outer membrane protein [Casimicrobiaceae bacterium]MDW8313180.1 TolC family outer membrane protein [Burkholderiales bacterium]